MSLFFILSQIFGFVALLLVCLSYYFDNKKSFLAYQIIGNIFYSASFLTLNVFVGGINTIISTIRVAVLYFFERKDKKPPLLLYITFALLYLYSGVIFFQDGLDILAIVAYEIFNIAMFARKIELTRILMVLPNFIIVIYNILNFTFTNAILDCVEIIVLIFAIFKFGLKNKREIWYLLWKIHFFCWNYRK